MVSHQKTSSVKFSIRIFCCQISVPKSHKQRCERLYYGIETQCNYNAYIYSVITAELLME